MFVGDGIVHYKRQILLYKYLSHFLGVLTLIFKLPFNKILHDLLDQNGIFLVL